MWKMHDELNRTDRPVHCFANFAALTVSNVHWHKATVLLSSHWDSAQSTAQHFCLCGGGLSRKPPKYLQNMTFSTSFRVSIKSTMSGTTEIRLTLLVGMVDKITGLLLVSRSLPWLHAEMEQKILNLNIAVSVWPYWFLFGQSGSTVATVWTLIWPIEKTRRNQTTTRHQWTVALCSAVCPTPFRSKSK